MKLGKTRTAYLRPIRSMTLAAQQRLAERAGCVEIYVEGEAGRKHDVRQAWINRQRPGDEAWVPRLDVLARPRVKGGPRPSADFAATIPEILSTGAILIDGLGNVSSRDGKAWTGRLRWAADRVASGRGMPRKRAQRMQAKSAQTRRERGVLALWLLDEMKAERERWAPVWRDPKYRNADEAAAALPLEIANPSTARAIFGGRDPSRKGVGGRPKMKTTG